MFAINHYYDMLLFQYHAVGVGHNHEDDHHEQQTTTHCEKLHFNWTQDRPYTFEVYQDHPPFDSTMNKCRDEQRHQHCLYMDDDTLFNVIFSGTGSVFPTSENLLIDRNTSIGKVFDNSKIVYDESSEMIIHGLGTYKGNAAIAEYRAVPQYLVRMGLLKLLDVVAVPQLSNIKATYILNEKWNHLANSSIDRQSMNVTWSIDYTYYPCSVIRRKEEAELPRSSALAFSESGKVNGTVEAVCNTVMEHCTGELQQYDSFAECTSFLRNLSHHDDACKEKFGEFAALGPSFMCKYLHHFMIPFSPGIHCAHAGKGLLPDSNGNFKCVEADCEMNETTNIKQHEDKTSLCKETDLDEIVQGTLYALPFCLTSMEMQICSNNCIQAINTYLGRFVESGTLKNCEGSIPGTSVLLDLINIDAVTLLTLCSGTQNLGRNFNDVVLSAAHGHKEFTQCNKPNQYVGTGQRCQYWDWDKIAMGLFRDWSQKHLSYRVTKSNTIATAECSIFSYLYGLYRNIEMGQVPWLAKDVMGEDIWMHPKGSQLMTSYHDVLTALHGSQDRENVSGTFLSCHFPDEMVPWMQQRIFNPTLHSTSSDEHKQARQFVSSVLPGLGRSRPTSTDGRFYRNMTDQVFNDKGVLDTEELLLTIAEEVVRGVMLLDNDEITSDLSKDVRDAFFPALTWFFSESWHRSQGYLQGTAYVSKRNSISRHMKKMIPVSEMESKLLELGFDASESTRDEAYDSLSTYLTALPFALVKLTKDIVVFIQRDPCFLLPLWNKSPERFIIEYTPLNPPVGGFWASTNATSPVTRFDIGSANRDPNIYPDPLVFNPDRDLSKVMTWNLLEGEGPYSNARACPARSFSVKFVAANAPYYFPSNIQCANKMKIYHGVKLYEDHVQIGDNGFQRILKTSDDRGTLFLFLNGFPDVPQEFTPIISGLQKNSRLDVDFWLIPMMDFISNDDIHANCKISEIASSISNLIRTLKDNYKNIYVVGHGFGGIVGWKIASTLGRDVLSGLITFTPHPSIFDSALRSSSQPAREVYFFNLMGPLVGSTLLAANDFETLDNLFNDEYWWPLYYNEYHRTWDELGAHKMTCFYRDNFVVGDDGKIEMVNPDIDPEINVDTDILLLSPTNDKYYPPPLFRKSMAITELSKNQIIQIREIHDASHHGALHGDSAQIVTDYIKAFTITVERKHLSVHSQMMSLVLLDPPPSTGTGKLEHEAITATLFLWILGVATGMALEIYFGNTAKKYIKLITGVHVIVVIVGLASKSYIGYFLAVIGTFRFGVPDISSNIKEGCCQGEISWNKLIEGTAIAFHHLGGILGLASSPTGLLTPASILFMVIPLSFQHFTLLFEGYKLTVVVNTILEVWYQLEFFAVEQMLHIVPRIGAYCILIAHYIFILQYGSNMLWKVCLNMKRKNKSDKKLDMSRNKIFSVNSRTLVPLGSSEEGVLDLSGNTVFATNPRISTDDH